MNRLRRNYNRLGASATGVLLAGVALSGCSRHHEQLNGAAPIATTEANPQAHVTCAITSFGTGETAHNLTLQVDGTADMGASLDSVAIDWGDNSGQDALPFGSRFDHLYPAQGDYTVDTTGYFNENGMLISSSCGKLAIQVVAGAIRIG